MKKNKVLGFNKLLSESWEDYKKNASNFALIVLLGIAIGIGGAIVSAVFLLPAGVSLFAGNIIVGVILGLIGLVLAMATFFLAQNWPYLALLKFLDNNKLSPVESYKQSLHLIIPFIWLTVLTSFIVYGGALLFLIPGIIASVWIMFGLYIMMFEKKRGFEALQKSKEYVTGYWFDVFILMILFALVGMVIMIIPSAIADYYEIEFLNFLIQIFIYFVWVPLSIIYNYKIYLALKKLPRKEKSTTPTLQIFAGLGVLVILGLLLLAGVLIRNVDFSDNDPGAYPNVQLEGSNQA